MISKENKVYIMQKTKPCSWRIKHPPNKNYSEDPKVICFHPGKNILTVAQLTVESGVSSRR